MAVDRPDPAESFRSQLLLYRSRSRLTQREFAARAGVHFRSVQDWETGANFPTAERLRGLIAALLETGGLSVGHEAEEALTLWAAVQRDSPRMHARSTAHGSTDCRRCALRQHTRWIPISPARAALSPPPYGRAGVKRPTR